jgi:predicted NBD/HSP70 family sugar kinase
MEAEPVIPTRSQVVEALVQDLAHKIHEPDFRDGSDWQALTGYIVDAALSNDDDVLKAAYAGLQWVYSELDVIDGKDADQTYDQGRVEGILDLCRWHLRRTVSSASTTLARDGLSARTLLRIANYPGCSNQHLAQWLGVDETQISRLGRHLRASGLATANRAGRENSWYATPRGFACLTRLDLTVERGATGPQPADMAFEQMAEGENPLHPRDRQQKELPSQEYAIVLNAIFQDSPRDLDGVQARTELPESTVAEAIDFLIRRRYVVQEPASSDGPGPFHVNSEKHRAIGISVTPRKLFGVLTTLRGEAVHIVQDEVDGSNPRQIVESIAQMCEALLTKEHVGRDEIVGLGVNLPGHIDPERGSVIVSPLASGTEWRNFPLALEVGRVTGFPTVIENDVNALVLHEKFFGEGQGLSNFVVMFVTPDGEGVGSGLVVSGHLIHGKNGTAGEIGHAPLGEERQCRCGKRSCLEASVGYEAIRQHILRFSEERPKNLSEASVLVEAGDPMAEEAFALAGQYFGKGLVTLINVLNPEMVIMSGPEEYIDRDRRKSALAFTGAANEAVRQHAYSNAGTNCRLVVRSLTGGDAARGAASLLLLRRLYELVDGPVVAERQGSFV